MGTPGASLPLLRDNCSTGSSSRFSAQEGAWGDDQGAGGAGSLALKLYTEIMCSRGGISKKAGENQGKTKRP